MTKIRIAYILVFSLFMKYYQRNYAPSSSNTHNSLVFMPRTSDSLKSSNLTMSCRLRVIIFQINVFDMHCEKYQWFLKCPILHPSISFQLSLSHLSQGKKQGALCTGRQSIAGLT